jgi:predicted nucleotidyltransferase
LFEATNSRLGAAFGTRLHSVLLFGSEARGTAGPGSDIDLLVLLADEVDLDEDLTRVVRALTPLDTEYENRCLTALPVSVREFEAQEFRLLRAAKREGIRL